MEKNLRVNIGGIYSLDDIDSIDLMVHIRHNMLTAAKDLVKGRFDGDSEFGIQCCETAEGIQSAIESFQKEF